MVSVDIIAAYSLVHLVCLGLGGAACLLGLDFLPRARGGTDTDKIDIFLYVLVVSLPLLLILMLLELLRLLLLALFSLLFILLN